MKQQKPGPKLKEEKFHLTQHKYTDLAFLMAQRELHTHMDKPKTDQVETWQKENF